MLASTQRHHMRVPTFSQQISFNYSGNSQLKRQNMTSYHVVCGCLRIKKEVQMLRGRFPVVKQSLQSLVRAVWVSDVIFPRARA